MSVVVGVAVDCVWRDAVAVVAPVGWLVVPIGKGGERPFGLSGLYPRPPGLSRRSDGAFQFRLEFGHGV